MSRQMNDNLFDSSKMTFGEHLEELRNSLLKAAYGLVIGVGIGFMLANYVVEMVQDPLKQALDRYYLEKATEELTEKYEGHVPFDMWTTIKQRHLIPKDEQVDPFTLLDNLRMHYPSQFEDFELDRYAIRLDEISRDESAAEMCADWKLAAGRDSDSVGRRAWNALTTEQRGAAEGIAGQKTLTDDDARILAGLLSSIVKTPSLSKEIYDTEEEKLLLAVDSEAKEAIESLARDEAESGTREHVRELNRLLLWGAYPEAVGRPEVPLVALPIWRPIETSVKALSAHEVFMIWLKAAIITGIVISSPWLFWHAWGFVAAGLYPTERKYVYIYLPLSLILFFLGVALAYNFVFEYVLDFLFSFNRAVKIDPDPRISEWIGFVLILPLGFGVSFQLPLVMLFMERIGLVSIKLYLNKWRVAILIIAVISMLLTPADPISMLLMAIPLTVLYFFGIALCKWMPKRRSPIDEAYEP